MPRPNRAYGRPGTRVIPLDWEASHAPVVAKTLTASCRVWPSVDGAPAPTMNDDMSFEAAPDAAAIYTGGARVQVQNGQQKASRTGEQVQVTVDYLVVLDRSIAGADNVTVGAVIELTEISDPTLLDPTRLYVAKVAGGSLRWERDLWCVDDLTRLQES